MFTGPQFIGKSFDVMQFDRKEVHIVNKVSKIFI